MSEPPRCPEPGCGLEMLAYSYNPKTSIQVCPRNADAHALCAKLAESEAKVRELEAKLANWKANAEHIQGNFQRETLRTSEQYQMLVKWMKRNADKGCSAEPWAKDDCPDCTLMRETKELLERPISIPREEARAALKEAHREE